MASDLLEPGRVLAGRYKLESRLGEGGFGTIWRAEHLALAAPVAVKLVDTDLVKDQEQVDRFLREARAAAALRSPHVVQTIDYGVDGEIPFIVMELLEGETLARRVRSKGKLSPAETGRILTHVGRAMARAHAGRIVHRDLKPENVFLVQNEDEEIAKVLDFGVAKVESTTISKHGARTRTGSLLGTPYYMSPEQAQGIKAVDHRSDLWSLAVIAFECLTGRRPFQSDGLGELVLQICAYPIPIPSELGTVPPGFDAWFKRATQRDPTKRFQTAKDQTESLREVLGLDAQDASMLPDLVTTSALEEDRRTAQLNPAAMPSGSAAHAGSTEGDAVTVLARADETPALPVRQAPTTQGAAPAAPQSGSGLVLAVAGTSIAVGLAVGFVVLSQRIRKHELPPLAPSAVETEHTPAQATPEIREERPTRPFSKGLDAPSHYDPTQSGLFELVPAASDPRANKLVDAAPYAEPEAKPPAAGSEARGAKSRRKDAGREMAPVATPAVSADKPRTTVDAGKTKAGSPDEPQKRDASSGAP